MLLLHVLICKYNKIYSRILYTVLDLKENEQSKKKNRDTNGNSFHIQTDLNISNTIKFISTLVHSYNSHKYQLLGVCFVYKVKRSTYQ